MELNIVGAATGNKSEVSTNNALRVTGELNTVATDGFGNPQVAAYHPPGIFEADAGTVTGKVLQRQGDISANYRQRVGIDTVMFCDQFVGGAVNTALWAQQLGTFSSTVSGGWITLNSTSSTTATAYGKISSYRGFPIFGAYPLQLEIEALISAVDQVNNVIELGFGIANLNAAPLDGAFFRFDATGQLRCVINNNGTEVTSPAIAAAGVPSANVRHHYLIVVGNDYVEFWIDQVLIYNYTIPAGLAMAMSTSSSPVLCRIYNAATAPAVGVQLKIGQVTVSCGDMNNNKGWAHVMAGMGGHSSQGQTAQQMGNTAQYPNSALPAAAVPTNTTAALGNGLGGLFLETDTLAVTNDGIISSFQVPQLGANTTAKTLYITRITVNSCVQTALTGGGYTGVWCVAYGHTAVSLATAEGVATKAPRRVALGNQAVASGAALGTNLPAFDIDLATPIPVQPGEFVQLVKRKIGTAPTAGAILHTISIGGYWE